MAVYFESLHHAFLLKLNCVKYFILLRCTADLEGALLQMHYYSLGKAILAVFLCGGGSPSTPAAPGAAPKSPPAPLQGASEHKSGFLLNCMADLEGALLQTHYHSLGKATGRVPVWGGSPSTPIAPGAAQKSPPAPQRGAALKNIVFF